MWNVIFEVCYTIESPAKTLKKSQLLLVCQYVQHNIKINKHLKTTRNFVLCCYFLFFYNGAGDKLICREISGKYGINLGKVHSIKSY